MYQKNLFLLLFNTYLLIESVKIEFPSNRYIEERLRQDLKVIDPIFRSYITPREVQFQLDAIKTNLPYFLQCQGSKKSLALTIPDSATEFLVLEKNSKAHTITAKFKTNSLTKDLVGRYTCSESVNQHTEETSVHVFIQDERSVFTKTQYPTVFQGTGVHFFNIPCQTTTWFPESSSSSKCNSHTSCIPVSYSPSNFNAEKVFFDPQIGFALVNPTIPSRINELICMSNSAPRQQASIPYRSSKPDEIQIEQRDLTVMKDETVRLSCNIEYRTADYKKRPSVYWLKDISDLEVISNQTDAPYLNSSTNLESRRTSIISRGFKPSQTYRFYCVRNSDGRIYARAININCTDTPTVRIEVNLDGTYPNGVIPYGSNAIYNVGIFTIPRHPIKPEITRNEVSLANDPRFQFQLIENRENQYFNYILTIYNITFEDEVDLNITARSSTAIHWKIIRPKTIGNPIGQLSFTPDQTPSSVPWRDEDPKNRLNIYSYGILPREQYRVVCNIRHPSNLKRALNVFIYSSPCSIDTCLYDLSTRTCQFTYNQNRIPIVSNPINQFQTQFTSVNSYRIDSPSAGQQYLCCYQEDRVNDLAKAITVLSNHPNMFHIHKPEFGLVIGDILTYRCEGHQLIYDDLQIIYNDGSSTYERKHSDNQWHLRGGRRGHPNGVTWKVLNGGGVQSTAIEVKTSPLGRTGNQGYFQCLGLSKRSDIISNGNDTYLITVENEFPLRFETYLPSVSRLDRKAGDNIELDCLHTGRPKPKIVWYKGKRLNLTTKDSAVKFRDENQRLYIERAQALDTGYYTCELNNGRSQALRRSFDLRIQGTNPKSKLGLLVSVVTIISSLLILLMLIVLLIFLVKFFRMKRYVEKSIFNEKQGSGNVDDTQPAVSQLYHLALPENFANPQQIQTFLNYVNGKTAPSNTEDFKELGRGQFGVVYQVRLPEIGLAAAKMLSENIRNSGDSRRRDKLTKRKDSEETEQMINQREEQKRKAAEMLIDEIKVMHKAGKHVNIVALKKVAYPETKLSLIFTGGTIRQEDSFYLMELCTNGSLESLLKRFLQSNTKGKPSLYKTLARKSNVEMTVNEAYEQCDLTDDDLKLIAYQVAIGVDYLNRRQIVHCDIAARNVLVTSRFMMKICDFGLATWTTYKNYREQLDNNDSVQLEKKTNEIATHNLTPELAHSILASTPTERLSLNKSSIKSDVWSFGIFLWTLFLKCRIRPFDQVFTELQQKSSTESFFHRLARIISEGRVLRYINYHTEIPRNIYGIIRECLVEESQRPEMTRIRAYLCHSTMLSKQAFEFYRTEYNQYQEANAVDGNVELFPEDQGVSDVPSFDGDYGAFDPTFNSLDVTFRPTVDDNAYYPEPSVDDRPYSQVQSKRRAPPPPPSSNV